MPNLGEIFKVVLNAINFIIDLFETKVFGSGELFIQLPPALAGGYRINYIIKWALAKTLFTIPLKILCGFR
jgi:hypothetical protein